uniref:Candidate secreted effector n=1 Tax=Meloidogyne incognita TaxID=6306 RepID=A0A914LFY6_MELIC
MFKFIILTCLIIKTHSWTWDDYPSPRGPNYSKCRVSKPAHVCDPDGMLTDQQRKEIGELVEDFKEKTKRPKGKFQCWRDGLRLVVALAKNKIGPEGTSTGTTGLCENSGWITSDIGKCETDVQGIELNVDGFRYCYQIRLLISLNKDEFERLNKSENPQLKNKDYFGALKNYIGNLRMLYIHRLSVFESHDSFNEDNLKSTTTHSDFGD